MSIASVGEVHESIARRYARIDQQVKSGRFTQSSAIRKYAHLTKRGGLGIATPRAAVDDLSNGALNETKQGTAEIGSLSLHNPNLIGVGVMRDYYRERFVRPNGIERNATGVYAIVNLSNGKMYVGSSTSSIANRLWGHRNDLKKGDHGNRHLQKAWDKYGEQCFRSVVLEGSNPKCCIASEQYWMDVFQTAKRGKGYNISPTAGNTLGVKLGPMDAARRQHLRDVWTKERRAEVGEESRRRWEEASPEQKKRQMQVWVDKWNEPGHRKKMADLFHEMAKDPAYREARRLQAVANWEDPKLRKQMLEGITQTRGTKESRNKTSEATKIVWQNEESRAKLLKARGSKENRRRLSDLHKGLWANPEYREKIIASHLSDEYRRRMEKVWNDPIVRAKKQATRKATADAAFNRKVKGYRAEIIQRYVGGEGAVHIIRDLQIQWNDLKRVLAEAGVPYRTQKEASQLVASVIAEKVKDNWADPEFKAAQRVKIKAAMAEYNSRKAVGT